MQSAVGRRGRNDTLAYTPRMCRIPPDIYGPLQTNFARLSVFFGGF